MKTEDYQHNFKINLLLYTILGKWQITWMKLNYSNNLTIDFSVKMSLLDLDIKIQGCVNYINYEEKFRAKTSKNQSRALSISKMTFYVYQLKRVVIIYSTIIC